MRTKAKFIITGIAIGAYVLVKETLNIEKRHDELEIYENGVNDVVNKINESDDFDKVININLTK